MARATLYVDVKSVEAGNLSLRRDPDRRAGRAGTTTSEVTLGGRRIRIPRPRVRSTAGEELALPNVFAAQRDPLDNHTLLRLSRL